MDAAIPDKLQIILKNQMLSYDFIGYLTSARDHSFGRDVLSRENELSGKCGKKRFGGIIEETSFIP